MRILLLSDIHANLQALEACLAAAPEHDQVVDLGDIVGYGANPNEVTERSRNLGGIFVRGNHDKACTGVSGLQGFNPVASLAATWTREVLAPENLEWLRALPQGPARIEGVAGVACVHGSPLDEDEYLIVMRDAAPSLLSASDRLTFFGHTHIQGGFSLEQERWETLRPVYASATESETATLELRPTAKYLVNPGSIGQPRDGDWRAAFALFDSDANSVTFFRVPYRVAAAQERIRAAGLPARLATRLAEGR